MTLRMTTRALGATLCTTALILTAACSDEPSQPVNTEPLPPGTDPATLILDGSQTPEGFTHSPVSEEDQQILVEFFRDDDRVAPAIEPAQCAGVIADGSTLVEWLSQPPETTATTAFTREGSDEDGIQVKVQTEPLDPALYPADIAECATTTKTRSGEAMETIKTFEVTPADIPVDGADVIAAAKVDLRSTTFDGEEMMPGGGETVYTVTATARGATFTLIALDGHSPEDVSRIATAQAQRIAEA